MTNVKKATGDLEPFNEDKIITSVLANPAVYPDEKVMKRLWAPKPFSEEQDRALTRAWQAIKSG